MDWLMDLLTEWRPAIVGVFAGSLTLLGFRLHERWQRASLPPVPAILPDVRAEAARHAQHRGVHPKLRALAERCADCALHLAFHEEQVIQLGAPAPNLDCSTCLSRIRAHEVLDATLRAGYTATGRIQGPRTEPPMQHLGPEKTPAERAASETLRRRLREHEAETSLWGGVLPSLPPELDTGE